MQTSSKIAHSKKEKESFNMMGKGRERRSRSILESSHMVKEPRQQEEKKTITDISIKDFNIIETIGKGSFGTVYLAERGGKKYAVKELDKDKILRVIVRVDSFSWARQIASSEKETFCRCASIPQFQSYTTLSR